MLWIDGTMGNVIYLEGQPEHTALSMGNGLTDTLISALLLSGSQLAKTDHEKRLIVWLAEKDQSAQLVWEPRGFFRPGYAMGQEHP